MNEGQYIADPPDLTDGATPKRSLLDIKGRLRVALDSVAGAAGLALDATLATMSAKLPAALGPTTPTQSLATVAAQSLPVCWQVPVATAGRALLIAWVKNTAYTVGLAVTNDTGKVYVCRTAGTSQNADGAGPTGTTSDITDGTAHWSYVAASATSFKGSMILRNLNGSAQPVYYSTSAALAPGGAELPAGQAEAVFYGDATTLYVATATSTATVSVVAYP